MTPQPTPTLGHTPGPWKMQLSNSGPRIYAVRPDGRAYRDPLIVGVGGSDVNVSRANARLIALAPELLAFVQSVAAKHDPRLPSCGDGPCKTCDAQALLSRLEA